MNIIQRVRLWLAKALYDLHPGLQYRIPIISAAGQGNAQPVDYLSAAMWHQANVWVRRSVNIVAQTIAPLPLQVLNTRTKKRVDEHPVLSLFRYVNPVDDSINLWQQWATDMLLAGEAGFEFVRRGRGQYAEVWARQPQTIYIRLADGTARRYGGLLGYRVVDGLGEPYLLAPDELCFFKFYNPLNQYRGLSPVSAIRMGIEIDEFSRAWSRQFFKRSARPDLAIVAPQGITTTEREEIEARFAARFAGVENAHGVVALEEGIMDVRPIDYPPVDTQWLEQRKFSRSEILSMYGVPEEIAGIGRDTYENFGMALKVLYVLTIMPLCDSRDAQLTEFLVGTGALREYERLVTDYSGVQVLQENQTQQIEDARGLWEMGVAANVAFETVGLNLRVAGGDVGYLPYSVQPVGTARPAQAQRGLRHKAAIPFGSEQHVRIMRRKEARLSGWEGAFSARLRGAFDAQRDALLARLRELAAIGRDGTPVTKAPNLSGLVNLDAEMRAWKAEFEPLFADAVQQTGLDALDELGLDINFDLDRPEVRAEIEGVLQNFAMKVNDDTYTQLNALFKQAELDGAGIEELMKRIAGYFADRSEDWQLERIARTVSTSLNNAGDEHAWKQSNGLVIGTQWLAALDARTRDAHRQAHGQIRPLGVPFEVGGELLLYPGDVNGSAGNVINCRCSRAAVLVGEALQ